MVRDCGFKEDVQLALLRAHASAFPANDMILPAAAFADFPSEPRFMESDLTIEKVADVLSNAAPKGLLMVRDELAGWLLGMNRFNAGARAFWLEAYGGRAYSFDRIKSAGRIYVPRLAVAWHGGVQPSRLTKLLTDADDGLLARFLWFWPEPVPFRRPKTAPNLAFAVSAFERLSLLEMGLREASHSGGGRECASIADGAHAPITVSLTEEAAIRLESFACQIQHRQFQSTGLINSALGKIRGVALRLSLILAYLHWAADDGIAPAPTKIGIEALSAAITLVSDYLIPMAQRVYSDITLSPADRATETLARWIIRTKAAEVYVRQIQRHERLSGLVTARAIHSACAALVTAGWLIPPSRGSNHGRAKQAYRTRFEIWRMLSRERQHP
jgi:hypothetical protein